MYKISAKFEKKLLSKLIPICEDFEPTIEWVHHVDHDTLLVYLPDFRRNQLKLLASSTQKLKITGKRPLGNNKWRRFKTELAISSDHDSDKISARFENDVLHVKHPKKLRPITSTQLKPQEIPSDQAMTETSTVPCEQAAQKHNTQQHPDEDTQKADRNCGDEAGVVTNTCEVSESELRCNYREVLWVRMAENIKKPRKPANFMMFVMSLLVLVIGLLYFKIEIHKRRPFGMDEFG